MKCRSRVAVILAGIMMMCIFTSTNDYMVVMATGTQQQIDRTEQEMTELEGKLDDTNENLEYLRGTQSDLKRELKNLNAQLTEVSERLEDLEIQIENKETEITDTQMVLEEARETEHWQYESMVIRVRDMYEQNDTSYLNAIIGAGSLAEMLNVADYFEKIAAYDRLKLEEYKQNRIFIEELEATLQDELVSLEDLKVQAEIERNKISGLISQTTNSISSYANQIDDAEQLAYEYEQELKEKEKDLEYLKKKLAEEIAMSQSAANSKWRNISEVRFAEGDRKLLANLIYCEAGGEPYEGKLAVGSVVINRVLSSVYPDTVIGVIYQRKQFSPVGSGRLDLALTADKATADCYRAADVAMSGMTNVGNCVYFRTPVEGLTGIQIGGHIFY